MNAFNWQASPRETKIKASGTNRVLNLEKRKDYLGLRNVEIQTGSISIDPTPIDSRNKTARIGKGAAI